MDVNVVAGVIVGGGGLEPVRQRERGGSDGSPVCGLGTDKRDPGPSREVGGDERDDRPSARSGEQVFPSQCVMSCRHCIFATREGEEDLAVCDDRT